MSTGLHPDDSSSAVRISDYSRGHRSRLRAGCLDRGWDLGALAQMTAPRWYTENNGPDLGGFGG